MIGKFLFFLSAVAATFIGLSADAATTSQGVDITVTHSTPGSCPCAAGNTPNVCINTPTVAANSPISVSWACGPGNPNSFIYLITPSQSAVAGNFSESNVYTYTTVIGAASSGTATILAPNAKVDRDLPWYVELAADITLNGGQLAMSGPVVIQKSIDPPAPVASLPSALSADPFTPAHTSTVCASGCDFTDLGTAVHNAAVNSWDNVKIVISAGDYQFPTATVPAPADYPAHTWIHGISPDGKTFPHIFGLTPTDGSVFFTAKYYTPGQATLTLDNLEIGYWAAWKSMIPGDATTWTLRNVYAHDGLDGLESGNSTNSTINIYNSVFARNGGGGGPDHNVYIGTGNLGNTVNVVNSVFETPYLGHAFKTRALNSNFTCSMFAANQDTAALGSQAIDVDDGYATINKSLLFEGHGGGNGWDSNVAWTNAKFFADNEAPAPVVYNVILTNSNFVSDLVGSPSWPATVWARFTSPPAVPSTWIGNNWVWPAPGIRDTSGTFGGTGAGLSTANGALGVGHAGNIADVTFDGTNHFYTSWAAAGFSLTPYAEPYGWRDLLPMMPSGCTDPVGLVKTPAS